MDTYHYAWLEGQVWNKVLSICSTSALCSCLAGFVLVVVISLPKRKLLSGWMMYFSRCMSFKREDKPRAIVPSLSEAVSVSPEMKCWILGMQSSGPFPSSGKHIPRPHISLPIEHLKAHAPEEMIHKIVRSLLIWRAEKMLPFGFRFSSLLTLELSFQAGNSCAACARQLPPVLGGWRGWQRSFCLLGGVADCSASLSLLETHCVLIAGLLIKISLCLPTFL